MWVLVNVSDAARLGWKGLSEEVISELNNR